MAYNSAHQCFYCRNQFTRQGLSHKTVDHVYPNGIRYPAVMVERAARLGIAPRELTANKVNACFTCNQAKAQLGPVKWLTVCPSEAGAAALRVLLLELGESPTRVERAFKLRSAKP